MFWTQIRQALVIYYIEYFIFILFAFSFFVFCGDYAGEGVLCFFVYIYASAYAYACAYTYAYVYVYTYTHAFAFAFAFAFAYVFLFLFRFRFWFQFFILICRCREFLFHTGKRLFGSRLICQGEARSSGFVFFYPHFPSSVRRGAASDRVVYRKHGYSAQPGGRTLFHDHL